MEYDLGKLGKCKIRKHRRAKKMTLTVGHSGSIKLTIPFWSSYVRGASVVEKHLNWIKEKLELIKSSQRKSLLDEGSEDDYLTLKQRAKTLVEGKVNKINSHYGFSFRKISVRNQHSRWGSCSEKGNLNFNYRVVFLPEKLIDYLVAHELCHLKEMNHSKRFWKLVAETVADYRECSKKLKMM